MFSGRRKGPLVMMITETMLKDFVNKLFIQINLTCAVGHMTKLA